MDYLTQERYDELSAELNRLKTEKRPEVSRRLKRAKELGDLSENSEYQEAREQQQRTERRIAELEHLLRNAKIYKQHASEIVEVGTTFTVERDGEERALTLVGPNEADPSKGLISNESPLGAAFLSRKAGETVTVRTPKGEAVYTILRMG